MPLPHPALPDARRISRALAEAGFQAFAVGGVVRDLLLDRSPHDIDLVTDATPDVVARLFPSAVLVGQPYGVVGVPTPHGVIDVATFRSEANYLDRRRPATVAWATAEADVKRRDFTINGLLMNLETRAVVDSVDGQRDLQLGLIRTIGDPATRFKEDPLRLLRAVRLKAELEFQYDPATYAALGAHASEIHHVSAERITVELNRLFRSANRRAGLTDLDGTGLLAAILPEVAALHGVPQPREFHREGDVFDHTLRAVASLPIEAPTILVWATLLHDVAKPLVLTVSDRGHRPTLATPEHATRSAALAVAIATRLKFPAEERDAIEWLIHHHMSLAGIEAMRPAKRERYLLDPRFPLLLELHRADVLGTEPSDLGLYEHDLALNRAAKARHARHLAAVPPALVTGDDLQRELGLEPSSRIGILLESLRDAQLAGKITTQRDALSLARQLIQRQSLNRSVPH
jgi:poly(A) polymerase